MCGRYALPIQPETLPEWFARQNIAIGRVDNAEKRSPHEYNIAPTSYVPVFRKTNGGNAKTKDGDGDGDDKEEHGIVEYMRWGLVPVWINTNEQLKKNRYSTFNARVENLETNRLWKGSLSKRCVVPVTGYYEWTQDGKKLPYYVKRKDDELMFIAGIYNHSNLDDEDIGSVTIITHAAPTWLKWLHKRMPVVLDPKDDAFSLWLDGHDTNLDRVLAVEDHRDLVTWYRVDAGVGNSRTDSKTYVLPLKESLKEPLAGLVHKQKGVKQKGVKRENKNEKPSRAVKKQKT